MEKETEAGGALSALPRCCIQRRPTMKRRPGQCRGACGRGRHNSQCALMLLHPAPARHGAQELQKRAGQRRGDCDLLVH